MRHATVEIHKEALSFSAGHFTIFSATEREHLHGHNYNVSVAFDVNIQHNGLGFDYRYYKDKMQDLCAQLDKRFLLPKHSEYLRLEETDDYWYAHFHTEKIPFLKRDVAILPLTNVTIEELAYWFLQNILHSSTEMSHHGIQRMTVKVYNGPAQSSAARWEKVNSVIQCS